MIHFLIALFLLALNPWWVSGQVNPGLLTIRVTAKDSWTGRIGNTLFSSTSGTQSAGVINTPTERIHDLSIYVPRGVYVVTFNVTASSAASSGLIASASYEGNQIPRSTTASPGSRWRFVTNAGLATNGWDTNTSFVDSSWTIADQISLWSGVGSPSTTSDGQNYVSFVSANGNSDINNYNAWNCIGNTTYATAQRVNALGNVECMATTSPATSCRIFSGTTACATGVDIPTTSFTFPCNNTGPCLGQLSVLPKWFETARWSKAGVGATTLFFRMVLNLTAVSAAPEPAAPPLGVNDIRSRSCVQIPGSGSSTSVCSGNPGSLTVSTFGVMNATYPRLLSVRLNVDNQYTLYLANSVANSPYQASTTTPGFRTGEVDVWVSPTTDYLLAFQAVDIVGSGVRGISGSILLDNVPISLLDGKGGLQWKFLTSNGTSVPAAGWNTSLSYNDTAWSDLNTMSNGTFASCATALQASPYSSAYLYSFVSNACQAGPVWPAGCISNDVETNVYVRVRIPLQSGNISSLVHPCACPGNATCITGGTNFACNPGYTQNGSACSPCSIGTYKSWTGNEACSSCANGVCSASTNISCNAGFYLNGTICSSCTAQISYKSLSGNFGCSACLDGNICNTTDVTNCTLGYFLNGTTCSGCPEGRFKTVQGTQSCTLCPAGATCYAGSSNFSCTAGYFWNSTACQKCLSGTIKPSIGNATCSPCPTNAACVGLGLTDFSCNAGYTKNDTRCNECAAETYKSSNGNMACSSCPLGSICNRTSIANCKAGYSWNGTDCVTCRSDAYKPAIGLSSCLACPLGATCDISSFTCDAGYYQIGTNCTSCAYGFYKPVSGNNNTCLACPVGSICDNVSVVACNLGFYLNVTTNAVPTILLSTVINSTMINGTMQNNTMNLTSLVINYVDASYCTPCSSGNYKSSIGFQNCTGCPGNSTCTSTRFDCYAGYRWTGSACTPCSAGTFKATSGNNDTCLPCQKGAICNATGIDTCSPGYFLNSTQCSTCSNNTYKPVIGKQNCTICPIGTVCNSTSLVSCKSGYAGKSTNCTLIPKTTTQSPPTSTSVVDIPGTDLDAFFGLLGGAMLYIVIGVIVLTVLLFVICVICCVRHRSGKEEVNQFPAFDDPVPALTPNLSGANTGGSFGSNSRVPLANGSTGSMQRQGSSPRGRSSPDNYYNQGSQPQVGDNFGRGSLPRDPYGNDNYARGPPPPEENYGAPPPQNGGYYDNNGQQGNYNQQQGNFNQQQGNFNQPQGDFNQPQGNYNQAQGNYNRQQGNYSQSQGDGYGPPSSRNPNSQPELYGNQYDPYDPK